ncbi:MAG: tetratricopeptide repeat protein, partial [Patescibacteria group bacterium]
VRFSFSKTNLLIANNMSQKLKLSDTEKQTIATLVQQAISEAKTLVTLNNKKATYWANLGEVYRNVLLLAQGADAWAISSYQRSLALDPNNPNYYFNLGSIYYVLGNYDESIRFFEQAAALKPNIPNFMYNLSWALFQKKDYLKAVNSMEAAVKLVDSKTDDYKKAKKELEEFKAMLPKEEAKTTEKQLKPETLSVPAPAASVTPQIKLPKDNEPPTQ